MNISYEKTKTVWSGYENILASLIEKHKLSRICDIGGGANPILDIEYITKNNLSYSVLDISKDELEKAPKGYDKIVKDICSPNIEIKEDYDFIFSKMLVEHIKDAPQLHKNIHQMLCDGGIAVHFFPTLYTFPFLINLLFPESLTSSILKLFQPKRDFYQTAKFPAYYKWCYGPVNKQINRFQELGYDIIEYTGLYGHDYYKRFSVIQSIHNMKVNYLLRNPNPFFTNFSMVVLSKSVKSS